MALNIFKFNKDFRPHLSYHYNVKINGFNFPYLVKSISLHKYEIETNDSKKYYGNTAFTMPIINFGSQQLTLTFTENENMQTLSNLGNLFSFLTPQTDDGTGVITIEVIEYEDDLNTIVKDLSFNCRLLELSQPEFSNTGSPGFIDITATFIIDKIIEIQSQYNDKTNLDQDTFTGINRSASPSVFQNLSPNTFSSDTKTYQTEEQKEKKTNDNASEISNEINSNSSASDNHEQQESTKPTIEVYPSSSATSNSISSSVNVSSSSTTISSSSTPKSNLKETNVSSSSGASNYTTDFLPETKSSNTKSVDVSKSNTTDNYNIDFIPESTNNSKQIEIKSNDQEMVLDEVKTTSYNERVDELAYQMMRGNVGNGDPRKVKASNLGYSTSEEQEAQKIVNQKDWIALKARHDSRVKDGKASNEKPSNKDTDIVLSNVEIKTDVAPKTETKTVTPTQTEKKEEPKSNNKEYSTTTSKIDKSKLNTKSGQKTTQYSGVLSDEETTEYMKYLKQTKGYHLMSGITDDQFLVEEKDYKAFKSGKSVPVEKNKAIVNDYKYAMENNLI